MSKKIYLKATGAAAKKAFADWLGTIESAQKEWQTFAASVGAVPDQYPRMGFWERPTTFIFKGDAPEGWLKKGGKLGSSRPKKNNKADTEAILALPAPKSLENLCAEAFKLPLGMSYKNETGSGSRRFMTSGMKTIDICWVDISEPILICPDYDSIAAEQDGDMTWTPVQTAWSGAPEGFTRMTEAEVDLEFAQARVNKEKAAEAA